MEFSKIAYKLREKIVRISGELTDKLDKTSSRFISESVYGILSSQSILLTEIGRSLEGEVSLKKIEERFCRQLGKPEIWEKLHESLLQNAAETIKDNTLLILDISDIQKKFAKKMEYVAEVRDGSEGVIGRGYWTCNVIGAEVNSNNVTPLYQSLYSQKSPDFKSENDEILKAIKMISSHIEGRGIYVIDRGGDRNELYKKLLSDRLRFIIRLVGTRHLICEGKAIEALELANQTKCIYTETVVRIKNGKEKAYQLKYGFRSVKLPTNDKPLWLLVVKGIGKKPMMLLTTEKLKRNYALLKKILHSYLKRWSIEETIRFIKQTYDLENIRIKRYVGLKNMMAILLVVFYFIAVKLDANMKLRIMTGHILKAAKRVFGIPDFKYYALGDGLSAIFERTNGKIWQNTVKIPLNQMSIGFT